MLLFHLFYRLQFLITPVSFCKPIKCSEPDIYILIAILTPLLGLYWLTVYQIYLIPVMQTLIPLKQKLVTFIKMSFSHIC